MLQIYSRRRRDWWRRGPGQEDGGGHSTDGDDGACHEEGPVVASSDRSGRGRPADTDPVEVLRTLIAPILFRPLISAEPIDEAVADQAARVALNAAKAGLLGNHSREGKGAPLSSD